MVSAVLIPASLAITLLTALPAAAPPDLILKGCVVSRDEAASVAVLSSGGRTRIVAVGEKAFGGELVSVAAEGVVLAFGTDRTTVRVSAAAPAQRPTPAPASTRTVAREAAATTTLNMPRADVDRRVALEMDRILAETALAPVTEGGRVTGVAVRRLAGGTVLSDVGLRVGDVITAINGTQIDGLATLMGLYGRLQGERQLDATILRDGQPVSLKLNLD
jgi:general secretion pathway protein C